MMTPAETHSLLCINAYRLYMSTLHTCQAPISRKLFETLTHPRVGDLVLETSTMYMRERDPVRLGRLLRDVREPCFTREVWVSDGGLAGDPIPTEPIFYIELPDGTEYRWHNASFIRVLEDPSQDTDDDAREAAEHVHP